jgi:hypothetical protein
LRRRVINPTVKSLKVRLCLEKVVRGSFQELHRSKGKVFIKIHPVGKLEQSSILVFEKSIYFDKTNHPQ